MSAHPPPTTLYAGPIDDPDRYRLQDVVSEGMEGRLWRSTLDIDGHEFVVALKEIHPHNVGDLSDWLIRWRRQAELLRSLDHPGLVRVREVFNGPPAHPAGAPAGGQLSLFLVLNWAEGVTLDRWAKGRAPLAILDVLGRVADAVDYLHSGGDTDGVAVLHRDLKPANIIVDPHGFPLLVDFGFARLADSDTQTVVGTPAYMPPEIATGTPASTASDRFSFGATAFAVLTGDRPTPTDAEGMRRRLLEVTALHDRPHLVTHCAALLDPDPAQRPADLGSWYGDVSVPARGVEPLLLPLPVTTPSAVAPEPSVVTAATEGNDSETAVWRWSAIGVAGVLVLAVVAGALVVTLGGEADQDEPAAQSSVPVIAVPDLTNLAAMEAQERLADLELDSAVIGVESTAQEGFVVGSDPTGGSTVSAGDVIELQVAGPTFVMPNVSGMTREVAAQTLFDAGHNGSTIDELYVEVSTAQTGTVVGQEPQPGVKYPKSESVRFELAVFLASTPTRQTSAPPDLGPDGLPHATVPP